MYLNKVLLLSMFTALSSAHADKVVLSFHGLGEVGQECARHISKQIGLPDDVFEQSKAEGFSFPVGKETYHIYNPLAGDIFENPGLASWFSIPDISTLTILDAERMSRVMRLVKHLTHSDTEDVGTLLVNYTAYMQGKDPIAVFRDIAADPQAATLFYNYVMPDVVRVTGYVRSVLDKHDLAPQDLILAGVSQGGIMAHMVATQLESPIHTLLMGISFPVPAAQFTQETVPNRVVSVNTNQDELFPVDFVRNMYSRQSAVFQGKAESTYVDGTHNIHDDPVTKAILAGLMPSIPSQEMSALSAELPEGFNPLTYIRVNELDIEADEAIDHYLKIGSVKGFGWRLSHVPAGFNFWTYLYRNPDLRDAAPDGEGRQQWAQDHYCIHGFGESREYEPLAMVPADFNFEEYISLHGDLVASAPEGKEIQEWAEFHYRHAGYFEGREYKRSNDEALFI